MSPIRPGSAFASRLRAWADSGVDMLLHGFHHHDDRDHRGLDRLRGRFLTADEGEFLGLTEPEASKRIADGRALIEDIIGRRVAGFVAPAWLYGSGAYAALAQSGLSVAEDHFRVWSPASGHTLARGPVITWASRTPARLLSSLAAAAVLSRMSPQEVLRVGVHPGDCSSPALLRSIRATLARATRNRRPAVYSQLVDRLDAPRGFEPRLTDSESVVLPLDDGAAPVR
jgi:predicted deacetylase